LSIPNFISLDIVSSEVSVNKTSDEVDADGNKLFYSRNVTKCRRHLTFFPASSVMPSAK
jgi:hypothetical protein